MRKVPTFAYYLPGKSVYFKCGFVSKCAAFLILNIIAMLSGNYALNLSISAIVMVLIAATGFISYNKKPILFIIYAIILFSAFWMLFSRVSGSVTYFELPWNTFVTDQTIALMTTAISKWILIAFSGLLFMITTSETELVDFLFSLNISKQNILPITIAFNTVGLTIKDIETFNYALTSRNFKQSGMNLIKRFYLIGNAMLLNSIKKIETLYQSYSLRAGAKR